MSSTDKKPQPKIKVYWYVNHHLNTSQTPTLTPTRLNESRSQRLLWLLEELHLEYDLEIFHRNKDMLAPPELKEIHPLGKAPIVTIQPLTPEGSSTPPKPLVLAESGFIMQYISDHFGQDTTLVPERYPAGQEGQLGAETEAWMRYQYYLHYSEGSLQPALLVSIILEILKSNKIPFPIRPITAFVSNKFFTSFVIPHLNTDLAFLESQLESSPDGGEYLCGKYLTPADIILSFPLELVKTRIGNMDASVLEKYPKLWAYCDRLRSSEGYKRAEKRIEEVEGKGRK